MKNFRKFIYLLEKSEAENNSGSYFSHCGERFWENNCIIEKGDWRFEVPSLGGETAKNQPDLIIHHNDYFGNNPVRLELKSFTSKLAHSRVAEDIRDRIKQEEEKPLRSTKTRTIFGASDKTLEAMKDILLSNGKQESELNSPASIISLFGEYRKTKSSIEDHEVHVPPVSTKILEQIEDHWRNSGEGIHGVFMSSGKSGHFKRHSTQDDKIGKLPKSYIKAYNQIHDIVDIVSEWKPLEKNGESTQSSFSNKGMKLWSLDEHSGKRMSDHNHGVSIMNSSEYRIHSKPHGEHELHYFVPIHLFDESGKNLNNDRFEEWRKLPRSKIYKKIGENYQEGKFINKDGEEVFEPRGKEIISEDQFQTKFENVKKRPTAIGLATEGDAGIHSGYVDNTSDRHILHQFLDDHYNKTRAPGKKGISLP